METQSPYRSTDRQPVAAGRFYSADKETLKKDILTLFETCKVVSESSSVRAIISPHAGYIFSGKTAAAAFSVISKNTLYNNIFIIGSSHIISFDGASVYFEGDYITPLGRIEVNKEIANTLIKDNKVFDFPATSHIQEHSLEVQLPFIQTYFTETPKIVPIIIGTDKEKTIKEIAEALRPWFTKENLFIISSDFSHYPEYNNAIEADRSTANGILSGSPTIFLNTIKKNSDRKIHGLLTSMCGWSSGLTLLYLSESSNLQYSLIDYCNSGDSKYGNKEEVVGYNAISLTEEITGKQIKQGESEEFTFTNEEKKQLFSLVRTTINSRLTDNSRNKTDPGKIPEKFMNPMGAFVTLKIDGKLRGCIGRFISSDPLYEVVKASAISSAFEDPRFSPLTLQEYNNTEIEITVLGPLKKISNINEIVLGKHGIYIKKDSKEGTMLPQVATENGWSIEEFLGYTSRDKAGLGWDGWKNAELFIYEGVVLEEKRK